MNLLTITCERDFLQTQLQANSIKEFVKTPCTHWVIVNEHYPDKQKWVNALTPYYSYHKLNLLFLKDVFNVSNLIHGWHVQQMLRCLAVNFIQDDYLILGALNFFIKPTNLSEWDFYGPGKVRNFETDAEVMNRTEFLRAYYASLLSQEIISEMFAFVTPFKVQKEIMKSIIEFDKVKLLFVNETATLMPSEFLIYSYFHKMNNLEFVKGELSSHIYKDTNVSDYIGRLPNSILISGLHRPWLDSANQESQLLVISWLYSLGILEQHTEKLFLNLHE